MRDLAREMSRQKRGAEERGAAAEGARAGKAEEQLVFMARACDKFQVASCSGLLGKAAFRYQRAAGQNSRPT